MKISIYMEFLAYKYGGAESYTANLIEYFQKKYPDSQIEIITESFDEFKELSVDELVARLNGFYGTNITSGNLSVFYFYFGKKMRVAEGNKFQRALHSFKINGRFLNRFNTVYKRTADSDLFINASFNVLAGNAKKNICIVHFPVKPLKNQIFWQRIIRTVLYRFQWQKMEEMYATEYDLYLPNSEFTSGWLQKYWKVPDKKIQVIYPPVITIQCEAAAEKKNMILACSRIEKDKQLDKLIKAYSNSDYLRDNYELVIAGSAVGEVARYVEDLKKQCTRVRVVIDPDRKQLEELYREAGIFWHAKGYLQSEPGLFEHFGITTVEAMSAGCIPVVIDKGGQKEIVNESCGYRWNTLEELTAFTCTLAQNNIIMELRKQCISRSKLFDKESFEVHFNEVISDLLEYGVIDE